MALVSYAESIAKLATEGAKKAKKQGRLGECGKMCDTCAFRWNQPHTLNYFLAADAAAYALMSEGSFNCHTHDFRDAKKPCAGFQLSKLVYETEDNNDPAK